MNDFINRNNVNRMALPAVSLDLSCIEHAWDVLGRAVSARLNQNSTLQDLRRFLREEWARIPQQTILLTLLSVIHVLRWYLCIFS